MGRKQTIFPDKKKLLAAIFRWELSEVRRVDRALAKLTPEQKTLSAFRPGIGHATREYELRRQRKWSRDVPYDLHALVGRRLTNSELVVYRKALREMESERLIDLDPPARPTSICLTRKGVKQAEELTGKKRPRAIPV